MPHTPTAEERSAIARAMAQLRTNPSGGHNGGRPRKKGKRCPCAVMTLKRALARGKSSEHDPSCRFYKSSVIIV